MNGSQFLDTGGRGLRVGLCSRGLMKFGALPAFLGLLDASFGYAFSANSKKFDVFVGWGRKPSGETAVRLAETNNRPFLLLEDGYLRSVFPASIVPSQALSIVTDEVGIYYDSTTPSQLEQHIKEACENPSQTHRDGTTILATLRQKQLCKYNNFVADRSTLSSLQGEDDHVLVIDQTAGDLSVAGAGASAKEFSSMLEAALDENPNSKIFMKSHPETSAGKRKGYLSNEEIAAGTN